MNRDVFNLLREIYKFYPIGMPETYLHYEGYNLYNELLNQKINGLKEKTNTQWNEVTTQMTNSELGKKYKVYDYGYLQSPSYHLQIELKSSKFEDLIKVKSLNLYVSILSNYFTIFFEDFYTIHLADRKKIRQSVCYSDQQSTEEYNGLVNQVTTLVNKNYSKHLIIDCHVLLGYKIRGCAPYNVIEQYNPYEDSFHIFDYLFHCDTISSNEIILK